MARGLPPRQHRSGGRSDAAPPRRQRGIAGPGWRRRGDGPFLSFDAQWAYYAYFYDVRPEAMNAQHGLPYAGADVFRLNLATRQIQQPTFGEFAPNTGAGHFDESNPVNPGSSFGRLGYGILNLAPAPIAGGKIAFTSNRNGFAPLLDEIPRHSRWARIPGGDVVGSPSALVPIRNDPNYNEA